MAQTKYITCPECEANFRETDVRAGKLPPHKFCNKTCPASGMGVFLAGAVKP